MLNILPQLQQYLDAKRWVVAYSGGVDSHVLLHKLAALATDSPCPTIAAIHINHSLQADANQWQVHCETVCQNLGIDSVSIVVNVDGKGGAEQSAREARYGAFEQYLQTGDVLFQGHHLDDQAETVLMRLLNGSGPKGLGGIPAQRSLGSAILVRPLLNYSKEDILNYAQQHQLNWVEDTTNDDSRYDRNFLRNEIFPLLAQRWPSVKRNLSRSGLLSAELSGEVATLAAADLLACDYRSNDSSVCIDGLLTLSLNRRFSVLRQLALSLQDLPPSLALLAQVNEALSAGSQAHPLIKYADVEFRMSGARLSIMPNLKAVDSSLVYQWDGLSVLELDGLGSLQALVGRGRGLLCFDHAVVKYRQGGERCKPAGRGRSQTVKKLLQEYGIKPWLRDRVPLIYIDDQLAAVGDLWVCEDFLSPEGALGLQLIWRY
jgi:tRNA(Ile)-lysidine synthase